MQLHSTLGAFLVALTIVHGAPTMSQANQDPALVATDQDAGLNPADTGNLPLANDPMNPSMGNRKAPERTNVLTEHAKKDLRPGRGPGDKTSHKDRPPMDQDKRSSPGTRSAPAEKRAPKGSSPGNPAEQDGGGSSLGKEVLTHTTSNLITEGILSDVDEVLSSEDAPAKRSPRGGGGGVTTSTRPTDGRPMGKSAKAPPAPAVRRSPRGGGGGRGGSKPKFEPGDVDLEPLVDILPPFGDVVYTEEQPVSE